MTQVSIARLHYLTQDLDYCSHAEQARLACKGGVRWVQCRIKNVSMDEWIEEAIKVKAVCERYNAVLIINDSVEVARAARADGVHLGLDDTPVTEARESLGPNKIIGGTANTSVQVHRRIAEGVDYIGLGPFRFTRTKKQLSPVLDPSEIKKIVREVSGTPIILIGGIQLTDVQCIQEIGARGIAVSSAINLANNPRKAAAQFINAMK